MNLPVGERDEIARVEHYVEQSTDNRVRVG